MPVKKGREYRVLQDFALVPREGEDDAYRVRGTAVVFNTPTCLYEYDGVKYYEVIDRHAFDECDMSDVIFNYNHGGKVVARLRNKTLSLTNTDRGLDMEADLSGTVAGRELYEALYLAIGAQKGASLGLDGEKLPNVINGVDYLALANSGKPTNTAKRVIVVGGGNVAIDVARTAIREGAESVDMYCLESAEEMPAAKDEQLEAQEEGIRFHCGWGPKAILDENGKATGIEFKKCTAVRDASGRFAPQYNESVVETVNAETILLAIGQQIGWGALLDGTKVETDKGGRAKVNLLSYQTSENDVFAGGDVVTGPKFAIDAIAAGKEGAISISRLLRNRHLTDGRNAQYRALETNKVKVDIGSVSTTPRQCAPDVDHVAAIHTFNDMRKGLTEEQIKNEAQRCLHCGQSIVDTDRCIGCGVCTHRCEFDAIHLVRVDDTQSAQNMANWYGRLAGNVVKRGIKIAVNGITGGDKRNS